MDKETEEWFKEINEKSKQSFKEHLKYKKLQEWAKQQIQDLSTPKSKLHYSTLDWDIDDSEFDDFSNKINEDLNWKDLTKSNIKENKGSE